MTELIKVQEQGKPAAIICPHCKNEILIDLQPFNKDVSKVLRDNCVVCRGEIFVAVLILAHPSLRGLLYCIQLVTSALSKGNILKM